MVGESLKYRMFTSLILNIIRAIISFSIVLLLARGLGPSDYGKYGFLLAGFAAVFDMLNLGTSNAFYTFISKYGVGKKHLKLYLGWLMTQCSVFFISVVFILSDDFVFRIWQGTELNILLFSFVGLFLQQRVLLTLSQIADSQRNTIKYQKWNTAFVIINCIIVLTLSLFEILSLTLYFYWTIISALLFVIVFFLFFPVSYSDKKVVTFSYYINYCYPLVGSILVASISVYLDPWVLNNFNKTEQQAYYTISNQFSTIVLLITTSVINILWKEIAENLSQKKYNKVKSIYILSLDRLYLLGVIISSCLIFQSDNIISIFFGKEYSNGYMVLSLMLLYPIDQARGQVNGMMFLAMEKTKVMLFLSVFSSIFGILVLLVLVGDFDNDYIGFNLGAVGVALKMLIIQSVTVNVSICILSKIFNFKYDFFYQIRVLSVAFGLAYIIDRVLSEFLFLIDHPLFLVLLNGALVLLCIILTIIFFPTYYNIKKSEIDIVRLKLCKGIYK